MRNIRTLASLIVCLFITQSGCKKEDLNPEENETVTVISTDVQTFEVVSLKTVGIDLNESYTGLFGTKPIDLIKTSDSTLVFAIPNIEVGLQQLSFDLTTINFNVTKTEVSNPSQTILDVFTQFDEDLAELAGDTSVTQTDLNSASDFQSNVLQFYNSLSEDQKLETALYYEANKEVFQNFRTNLYSNIDAPTHLLRQSNCPTGIDKEFYFCTCTNIGESAGELKDALVTNAEMLALAGAGGLLTLNPVTSLVGLGVGGFGLATAAYIFMVEVRPAWIKFRGDIVPFLKAQWILGEKIFIVVQQEFASEESTDLNLEAELNSISTEDAGLSNETSFLVSSLAAVKSYWSNVQSVFGSFPSYENDAQEISLQTNEITISNISNPNVVLDSQSGERVTFKTLSGEDENFSFNIHVDREGFSEQETINAVLTAEEQVFDFTGSWLLSYYNADVDGNQYLHQEERFTCNSSGYAAEHEVRYPTNPPPGNDWQSSSNPIFLSYANSQIVLNSSLGWYVDVNNVNDVQFYSPNWNLVYSAGDYESKHKLERQ